MALTTHMTASDMLRIRKHMSQGITDVATIQQTVLISAVRIQQVIDTGLDGPAKAQAVATARDKAELAAAKARMAKEEADRLAADAEKVPKADPPKKQTAAQKAKAKAAAKVDPVS